MLFNLRKLTDHSRFVRQVLTLMAGTTASQSLLLLAVPILARLYEPEQFGLLALFTSLSAVLSVPAAGRYELAVIPARSDTAAVNLLGLSLLIAAAFATVLVPVLLITGGSLVSILSRPDLEAWLWLVPPTVFVLVMFQALSNWQTRRQQYRPISEGYIVRAVGEIGIQAVVFRLLASGGLILGRMTGHAAAFFWLGWRTLRMDRNLLQQISWKGIRQQAAECIDYPRYSTGAALLATLSLQLPPFLLAAFFTVEAFGAVVGFYAVGHRLIATPMSIISRGLAQVFFQKATEHRDRETRIAFKLWGVLLPFAGIISLFVVLAGPFLIELLLGAKWSTAGIYTRWISVWILFQFIAHPLSNLTAVHNRLRLMLVLQVFRVLLRLAALITGGLAGNPLLAIILLSLVSAVYDAFSVAVYIYVDSGYRAALISAGWNLAVLAVVVSVLLLL